MQEKKDLDATKTSSADFMKFWVLGTSFRFLLSFKLWKF